MKNQKNQKSKIQILVELEALLNEQDLEKLEAAIYDLEPYLDIPEVVDTLKSLLEGRALRTELVAIEVLGKTKSEDLISTLRVKSRNPNTWIQAASIEALGNLGHGNQDTIKELKKLLGNGGWNSELIAIQAMRALYKLGENRDDILQSLLIITKKNLIY